MLFRSFVKRVGISFEKSKKLKNCNLKERILNSSDLILSIMLLSDHFINFTEFWNIVNDIFNKILVKADYVFKECHRTEKNTMIFLIKATEYFW